LILANLAMSGLISIPGSEISTFVFHADEISVLFYFIYSAMFQVIYSTDKVRKRVEILLPGIQRYKRYPISSVRGSPLGQNKKLW